MCVGLFMAVLDIQVVASRRSPPSARRCISPPGRLGWIQTGYLMAEVIAIPLTGLLTRALSLRWMFVGATLGFTLASLGCALSTTVDHADRAAGGAGLLRRHADPRRSSPPSL